MILVHCNLFLLHAVGRKGAKFMNRKIPKEKLSLSGIDENAGLLAARWGLGYEVTEFCWAPRLEDPALLERLRASGLPMAWLHAPYGELFPCAVDPRARELAKCRFRQTVDLAVKLGVFRVVVHGGFVPYVYFPSWYVEQSVLFWRDFLRDVPEGMVIALENVMEPGPEDLVEIVRQVDDPRLGLCLDVGHANTCVSKTPPFDWIGPMAPWLRHVHLHNNSGGIDLHDPLGQGTVPMERVLDELLSACPEASYTIENRDCRQSLSWLVRQGYLEGGVEV